MNNFSYKEKNKSTPAKLIISIPPQTEDALPEVITLSFDASEYLTSLQSKYVFHRRAVEHQRRGWNAGQTSCVDLLE